MINIIKIEFECLCNLKCDYCFLEDIYKVDCNLVMKNLMDIVKQYDKESTFFRIEGVGEITIYPEIVAKLNQMVGEGYKIKALSNGTNLKVIKDNLNIGWSVSLDGNTEKMNQNRHLSQEKIDAILDCLVDNKIDIQCVYNKQTVEEMNGFIDFLKERGYQGMLHIFPVKDEHGICECIPYEELHEAEFLAKPEYFEQWKQIYKHTKRTSVCNFFKTGYVYRIMHDGVTVKQTKCDCGRFPFESEKQSTYDVSYCDGCINHYEYEEY